MGIDWRSWIRIVTAGALVVLSTRCPRPTPPIPEPTATPSPSPTPSPTPAPTPTPVPTPLPETFIPSSRMETAKLFSGLEVHSKVSTTEGEPALKARKTPDACLVHLHVN